MSSIFLSQMVPPHLVGKYKVSQAANNFCLSINNIDYFTFHIAVAPNNFLDSYDQTINGIHYLSFRKFGTGKISKVFNNILENFKVLKILISQDSKNIWFYNLYPPNILLFLSLRYFSNKRLFILLADYNPLRYSSFMSKLLERSLGLSDGIISLSGRFNKLNNNTVILPGILNPSKLKINKTTNLRFNFLISGTLNYNTGIFLALDVFSKINSATLFISGTCSKDVEEIILNYSKNYTNIIYLGYFESLDAYSSFLFDEIDYVLSLRNPQIAVNNYNFPSKILEALGFGKVIISTINYPEILGINYLVTDYDVNSFYDLVMNIVNNNGAYCNREHNVKICIDRFSFKSWKKVINEVESNN